MDFVARVMRMRLSDRDRIRIRWEGRAMARRLCDRHESLHSVVAAADAQASEKERERELLRAEREYWRNKKPPGMAVPSG